MEDIAPSLLKKIQSDFNEAIEKSEILKSLTEKIEAGTATYIEANDYAIEVGNILARVYSINITADILPDGKMYYNIANRIISPTMQNNYNIISKVAMQIQTALNESAGIGINAIQPELNVDRIEGIVNRVSAAESYEEIAWILDDPIVIFSQSIIDDSIKANSEFQGNAGLQPKITRKIAGGCCAWCLALAGTYTYPDVPKDVYRRHQRCRCTVVYDVGKYFTDVHSKRTYDESGNAINRRNLESGRLKVNSKEDAEFIEAMLEKEEIENEKKRIAQLITEYQKSENVSHRRAANRIGRMLKSSNEDDTEKAIKEFRKIVGL